MSFSYTEEAAPLLGFYHVSTVAPEGQVEL